MYICKSTPRSEDKHIINISQWLLLSRVREGGEGQSVGLEMRDDYNPITKNKATIQLQPYTKDVNNPQKETDK